jgi:hypothetical protein
MKIRMASALTNPVMTERETNCISRLSRSRPATIWITPIRIVAANRYSTPWSRTSGHHENRDSRRGSRNHAGTPADQGDRDGNGNRGVKPDPGIHAGDDRKADRLGNKGKRDDDASQNVPAGCATVSEPLAAIIIEIERHGESTTKHMAPKWALPDLHV